MKADTAPSRCPGRRYLPVFLLCLLAPQTVLAQHGSPDAQPPDTVLVRVGQEVITQGAFEQNLRSAMRQKFYHFRPPEGQMAEFRREVAQEMVERMLLLQEAARRDITADPDRVETRLDGYTRRYAEQPGGMEENAEVVAALRHKLEADDRLSQLQQSIKSTPVPSDAEVRSYYDANQEQFTEPRRQRISLILLKVDPSSSSKVWQSAMEEGAGLVEKLRSGADFGELARLHSGDLSAQKGGDMGYLHDGMLTEQAEAEIAKLAVGEISEPIRMLEGIAIFRVDERTEARLLPFDAVRERAGELAHRARSEAAWTEFKQELRETTPVEYVDETLAEPAA